MKYELQPLRLTSGWKIEFNSFTEYDVIKYGEEDSFELCEDLLQLYNEKSNLIIDLGWYQNFDINGNYVLLLIKNFNWDAPLRKVVSKSKKEIKDYIEKWVYYG